MRGRLTRAFAFRAAEDNVGDHAVAQEKGSAHDFGDEEGHVGQEIE